MRELLNLLERAAVLEEEDFGRLVARHREMNAGLAGDGETAGFGSVPDELEQVVRNHVQNVFFKYAQNLSRAAAALKISRNTLRKHLDDMERAAGLPGLQR